HAKCPQSQYCPFFASFSSLLSSSSVTASYSTSPGPSTSFCSSTMAMRASSLRKMRKGLDEEESRGTRRLRQLAQWRERCPGPASVVSSSPAGNRKVMLGPRPKPHRKAKNLLRASLEGAEFPQGQHCRQQGGADEQDQTWASPETEPTSAVRQAVAENSCVRSASSNWAAAQPHKDCPGWHSEASAHGSSPRGGIKLRGLRLDTGNFSWPSRGVARKTRIIDTVYNASNNELVRTKTLWFESHYLLPLARKKEKKSAPKAADKPADGADKEGADPGAAGGPISFTRSKKTMKKYLERQKKVRFLPRCRQPCARAVRPAAACTPASPPGLASAAERDGYILEGKELDFYLRKIRAKKTK
uniref:40S ribosomal protein S8 n=1 Tax=Macrostomum lignano TaxID=282301 RepID=A0A1I8JQW2_9PLAT